MPFQEKAKSIGDYSATHTTDRNNDLLKLQFENGQVVFIRYRSNKEWILHEVFVPSDVRRAIRDIGPNYGAPIYVRNARVGEPVLLEVMGGGRSKVISTRSKLQSISQCHFRDAFHDDLELA